MNEEGKTIDINRDILQDAIEVYGEKNQISMFFEESAELQELLAKYIRGRDVERAHIQEEIADVYLVLLQLMEIFGPSEVLDSLDYKVNRLMERIEKAKEKKQWR